LFGTSAIEDDFDSFSEDVVVLVRESLQTSMYLHLFGILEHSLQQIFKDYTEFLHKKLVLVHISKQWLAVFNVLVQFLENIPMFIEGKMLNVGHTQYYIKRVVFT
jgi:hypothetical protein